MTRSDMLNGGAVVGVLVLGSVGALLAGTPARVVAPPAASDAPTASLVDATGLEHRLAGYERVASGCPVSDAILLELVAPERLVAVTDRSRESVRGWRFPEGASIRQDTSTEGLVSLEADLIFVCSLGGSVEKIERAREAGLVVFDLGTMLGLETLVPQVRSVAAMVGEPERGEDLVRRFETRLAGIAADLPPERRPRGMYLSVYGDQFFGGTAGSSYHDVLSAAGVIDLAAEHGFEGWPAYDTETLLSLDPALVVTREGGTEAICGHSQIGVIAACGDGGRVVELGTRLIDDPGLGMLEAAEALRLAVHGPP